MYINELNKFGHLKIKTPQNISAGSNKKIEWICDCGKTTSVSVYCVTRGKTKSCTRCNEIPAENMKNNKYGKLQIKTAQNIKPGCNNKVWWICDCGKEIHAKISHVISGLIKSCSRCNEIPAYEFTKMKFGKLRIKVPQNISPGSSKKIEWICDCGNKIITKINYVTSGKTKSCGKCYDTVFKWYAKNKDKIRSLKCPINPEDVPSGGVVPLESIIKVHQRFKALCPACKKPWNGYWNDIKLGKSITCGCTCDRVSSQQRRIFEIIKSYDPNVQLEYKLGSFYYDIFVPSKNLLIEYDGKIYHSSTRSKQRDLRKHKFALDYGYQFMRILEKDWLKNMKEAKDRLLDFIS
jgi:hypothetical protein